MSIDWSILNASGPVDIAGNFSRGYALGQGIVDKYHERNALATLAQSPNDSQAIGTLYQVDPQMGEYFQKRGQEEQAQQRRQTIAQQYTTDPRGAEAAAVGAGEFDLAKSLMDMDKDGQTKAANFFKIAGPLAYQMRQMTDPAQRQAFLQAQRPMLVAEGVDPKAIDGFDVTDDKKLDGLIAANQTVDQLINQNKIEWHQQGENPSFATDAMGHPVGTQNPALVHAPAAPTATDAHGNKIQYNPQTKAWEPVGGAGGNASGNFPHAK